MHLFADPEPIPELVIDETVTVPAGETGYRFEFDDATVELLAQGVCSEEVSKRAFNLLEWKRRYARVCARETERTA